MAYEFEQDQERMAEAGGGFLVGLLSGVVLGLGLGMLFAPRSGAEMRQNLAESASEWQRKASDSIGQVSSKVRETADRARSGQGSGTDWTEAAKEAAASATGTTGTSGSTTGTGSGFGSGTGFGTGSTGSGTGYVS